MKRIIPVFLIVFIMLSCTYVLEPKVEGALDSGVRISVWGFKNSKEFKSNYTLRRLHINELQNDSTIRNIVNVSNCSIHTDLEYITITKKGFGSNTFELRKGYTYTYRVSALRKNSLGMGAGKFFIDSIGNIHDRGYHK
jgi:hypothetical protein